MSENNELEKTLWAAADKLRSNIDAAEYKHIVLGLIFLKYISDAFNDLHNKLKAGKGEFEGADAEDADEYLAHNIFFVPEKARWHYLQDRAKKPDIGKLLDDAMDAIEKINASLKGVLPKIYADPPFNISDWSGNKLRDDVRWKYGVPPAGNANYAWLQHFISKLSPSGTAGIVLANGSMNSNSGGEGEIRKNMIEAGLIDCMVALPAQLFYNTMIPACLWFLARNKSNGKFRNRSNEILFIDARKLGAMVNRRNKELSDDDIKLIAQTYHNWRGKSGKYEDKAGFCKSATIEEVRNNDFVLMPGRYVGTEEEIDDGVPFEEKMSALTAKLAEQFAKGNELEKTIRENLKRIGYEF